MTAKETIRIRFFTDADGVFSDFVKGCHKIGLDPDSDVDRKKMWLEIKKIPDFWQKLDKMPDADGVWNLILPYNPVVLTGVSNGNEEECNKGKREFFWNHYKTDKVIVVDKKRKPEFLFPGDILLDDTKENIDAWEEKGGIGIYYTGLENLKKQMKELGLENGSFSSDFIELVKKRREEFKIGAYSAYIIKENNARELYEIFGHPVSKNGTYYNIVCHHVTKKMPIGMDDVYNSFASIKIVGKIDDDEMGVSALICEVDGQLIRQDGGIYHITYALDSSEVSMKFREKKPSAFMSNTIIEKFLKTHSIQDLYNVNPIELNAEYFVIPTLKKEKMENKKIKTNVPDMVNVHEYDLDNSLFIDDVEFTKSYKEIQYSGTYETIFYYLYNDGKKIFHNLSGPAIIKKDVEKDKIVFEGFFEFGKKIVPPISQPKF